MRDGYIRIIYVYLYKLLSFNDGYYHDVLFPVTVKYSICDHTTEKTHQSHKIKQDIVSSKISNDIIILRLYDFCCRFFLFYISEIKLNFFPIDCRKVEGLSLYRFGD